MIVEIMNTVLWVLILLIVFLLVAITLPNRYGDRSSALMLKNQMERKRLMERKPTCEMIGTCARPCQYNNLNAEKKRAMENTNSKADIDSYFQEARTKVPDDYPVAKIGCCPYAKPLSRDLPIADVPMCLLERTDNMHLESLAK